MMAGGMVSSTCGARSRSPRTRTSRTQLFFTPPLETDAPAISPYSGISLGKSAYYEHILVCSKKDDSDRVFEVPSEDDDVLSVCSVPSVSSEPTEGNDLKSEERLSLRTSCITYVMMHCRER